LIDDSFLKKKHILNTLADLYPFKNTFVDLQLQEFY